MSEDEYTRFRLLLELAEKIANSNKTTPKTNARQSLVIVRTLDDKWLVTLQEETSDHPIPQDGAALIDALEAFILQPRK